MSEHPYNCLACDQYWFPMQRSAKCFHCKQEIKNYAKIKEEAEAAAAIEAVAVDKKWREISEQKRESLLEDKRRLNGSYRQSARAIIQATIKQATIVADVKWGKDRQVCYTCGVSSLRRPYHTYGRSNNFKVSYKVCKCKAIINPYTGTILSRANQPIENWINVWDATKRKITIEKIAKLYVMDSRSIIHIQKKLKLAKQADIDLLQGIKAKLVIESNK